MSHQLANYYQYLIAFGSNSGDRLRLIYAAINELEKAGSISDISSIYETEPVGAADGLFLNGALVITCKEPPKAMLAYLLSIEKGLGRIRRERWGNRTIDLDIILGRLSGEYSQTENDSQAIIVNSEDLVIPHPHMLERNFVIIPAAEIAPDWQHPLNQKPLRDYAREFRVPFKFQEPLLDKMYKLSKAEGAEIPRIG